MKSPRIGLASMAIAGGALVYALVAHEQATERAVARQTAHIDELEERIEQLSHAQSASAVAARRTLNRIEMPSPAEPPASARAGALAEAGWQAEGDEPRIPENVREEGARLQAQLGAKLEHALTSERPDPAWQPEAALLEALRATAGTRVLSSRCGATLCKVELTHDGADTSSLLDSLTSRAADVASSVFVRPSPEDRRRVTLYIGRPGHTLGEAS